eukprot:m.109451 g.109451  ORF g.109451 m.109451 type:complete len:149 (-) comp15246_c0_seq3:1371-1817(-)
MTSLALLTSHILFLPPASLFFSFVFRDLKSLEADDVCEANLELNPEHESEGDIFVAFWWSIQLHDSEFTTYPGMPHFLKAKLLGTLPTSSKQIRDTKASSKSHTLSTPNMIFALARNFMEEPLAAMRLFGSTTATKKRAFYQAACAPR